MFGKWKNINNNRKTNKEKTEILTNPSCCI